MGGFVFRFGVRLKDWGERLKWVWLIGLGLKIREVVLRNGKAK
jgi:hypothetical protein